MGTGNAPSSGFGASSSGLDDCLDGKIFPASVPAATSWAATGTRAGKIVMCGGSTGDMSNGSLYLTTRVNSPKAYAIVFNSLTSGQASHMLRRYGWNGSAWSNL